MTRLIIFALLVSKLLGPITDTSFYQDYLYSIDFNLYILAISATYISAAFLCYKIALYELKTHNHLACCLISALSICMLISALFNLIMIDGNMYSLLVNIKQGEMWWSWKNLYKAVEFSVIIGMVINGLNKIPYMDANDPIGYKAANWRDSNNYQGKQQ